MHAAILGLACLLVAYDPDPPLEDVLKFPATVAQDNWRCAVAFCAMTEARSAWEHDVRDVLMETFAEARRLERIWDALDDAARKEFPRDTKVAGLRRLKRLIGREAYDRGEMPPCVPVWRLARID